MKLQQRVHNRQAGHGDVIARNRRRVQRAHLLADDFLTAQTYENRIVTPESRLHGNIAMQEMLIREIAHLAGFLLHKRTKLRRLGRRKIRQRRRRQKLRNSNAYPRVQQFLPRQPVMQAAVQFAFVQNSFLRQVEFTAFDETRAFSLSFEHGDFHARATDI